MMNFSSLLLLTLFTSFSLTSAANYLEQGVDLVKQVYATREACWLGSQDRGVGIPPDCPSHLEYDAGLCYKRCPEGYLGVGPMCWVKEMSYGRGAGEIMSYCGKDKVYDAGLCYPRCASGYRGIAFLCWRNFWDWYSRGVGTIEAQCYDDQEQDGLLCYPKCRDGFHGIGPVCWNDNDSFGRGVGVLPSACSDGRTFHHGLCYKECPGNNEGILHLCWGTTCFRKYPYRCGLLCMKNKQECEFMIAEMTLKGLTVPLAILTKQIPAAVLAFGTILNNLRHWRSCLSIIE